MSALLEHCVSGFTAVTDLVDVLAPKSSLYRVVKELVSKGWLVSNGKNQYKCTPAGTSALAELKGNAPTGFLPFYPPLAKVPTSQHRAVIELAIAAVIARRFEVRTDRHPTFVLAGKTLQWKTSAGIFLSRMLGLDPASTILNLAAESGKSLWVRKSPTGEVTYEREVLKKALVVFDEYQAADPQIRRLVGIFIDGRKDVNVENERVRIEPVPVITMNPGERGSLEERLGLTSAQVRRSMVCDLNAVEVPQLALGGEEPLKEAKARGRMEILEPKSGCTPDKARTYDLLQKSLTEEGLQHADLEMLLMLATAVTGYFGPEGSINMVLHNALLLFETVGWTRPGWRSHFGGGTLGQGAKAGTRVASDSTGQQQIPQETWVAAFKLLDENGKPTDLVTRLELSIGVAETIAKKYEEMRKLDSGQKDGALKPKKVDKEMVALERDVQLAELRRKKAEALQPAQQDYEIGLLTSRVDSLQGEVGEEAEALAALKERFELVSFGGEHSWKEQACMYNQEGYCTGFTWKSRPDKLNDRVGGKFKFAYIEGAWHIKTSGAVCGPCTVFEREG